MVKYFKKYGRKYNFRSKRFRRRKLFAKRVARVTKRTIKRMSETKYFFTRNNPIAPNTNGPVQRSFNLDNIALGTGYNNRIGQKIQLKRITIKLEIIFLGQTGGATDAFLTIWIVWPRKTQSGAGPGVNELLPAETPGPGVRFTNKWMDPTVWYVLKEWRIKLQANNQPNQGAIPTMRTIDWSKRTNYTINYTQTNYVDREPLIIFTSSLDSTLATTQLYVQLNTRVSFLDI